MLSTQSPSFNIIFPRRVHSSSPFVRMPLMLLLITYRKKGESVLFWLIFFDALFLT